MVALDLVVINEAGHPWAEVFLDDWLPDACQELQLLVGLRSLGPLPVVLSTHERHASRFPPREEELERLLDEEETGLGRPLDVLERWSTYAHGVCTVGSEGQNPPEGVAVGEPVIYLDVDRIER